MTDTPRDPEAAPGSVLSIDDIRSNVEATIAALETRLVEVVANRDAAQEAVKVVRSQLADQRSILSRLTPRASRGSRS